MMLSGYVWYPNKQVVSTKDVLVLQRRKPITFFLLLLIKLLVSLICVSFVSACMVLEIFVVSVAI